MANLLKSLLPASALMLMMWQPAVFAETQSDLITRGQYLATAGDCGACHTDSGKAPFSGGHAIISPIGTIFSTNITPSKTAGIGNYSEAQFADALRKGVRGDGSQLYPAMPYTAYAKLTDDDVSALYAYFMHGVKAADTKPQKTELPFPFNLRFSMAGWNLFFLDAKPFTPDADKSAEWNRGAYLVQGLTHCSTCHTPRNFLMAEQQDKSMQGASLGTWFAPDITAKTLQDKQRWARDNLTEYLRTGHAANGATAGGPMLEAVDKSFSRMTEQDRQAIADFLLPEAQKSPAVATTPANTTKTLSSVIGDDTPEALSTMSSGESVYRNNCASCHNLSGLGLNGLPALKGHPVLEKPNADNIAMAILQGVWPDKGQGMIGFAKELNDQQIANVTNYVMTDIGTSNVQITSERVKELRNGGKPSPLLLLARGGMAGGVVVMIALIFWWWRQRYR